MNNFYLSGIGFLDGLFLPVFYFLGLWVPPDPEELSSLGVLDGLTIVMSWVGYLHDTSVFPLYFSLTLDLLVFSFLASLVLSFIRWVVGVAGDIIPF